MHESSSSRCSAPGRRSRSRRARTTAPAAVRRARALGHRDGRVRPDRRAAGRRRPRLARGAVESVADDAGLRGRRRASRAASSATRPPPRRCTCARSSSAATSRSTRRRRSSPATTTCSPASSSCSDAERRRAAARVPHAHRPRAPRPTRPGCCSAASQTLEVRIARQTESAAASPSGSPRIRRSTIVRYPGFGWLLSFDVADGDAARRVETRRPLIENTTSLGGVRVEASSRAPAGRATACRPACCGSRSGSRTRTSSGPISSGALASAVDDAFPRPHPLPGRARRRRRSSTALALRAALAARGAEPREAATRHPLPLLRRTEDDARTAAAAIAEGVVDDATWSRRPRRSTSGRVRADGHRTVVDRDDGRSVSLVVRERRRRARRRVRRLGGSGEAVDGRHRFVRRPASRPAATLRPCSSHARPQRCPPPRTRSRAATRRSTSPGRHLVLGTPLVPPFPDGTERAIFGMGCFWGAERMFWQAPGVYTTAVGYAGGFTPNPTYEEVCSGRTGPHRGRARRLRPRADELRGAAAHLLGGPRPDPGHAAGERRRHAVPLGDLLDDERAARRGARVTRHVPGGALAAPATATITTEIAEAGPFYYAEDYHQQYLAANPNGYCGLGGTGVACPIGTGVTVGELTRLRLGVDGRDGSLLCLGRSSR